ncbi:uncharacterized protein LOC118557089 isoform X2 [Fundulus heteroclitus]|uniref:uncharacterized protein LOC118557089 isoform X2 n=1 Tax=Fundulus heteroclitus TaxID=8078 RepID=UPI00165BF90D|nr:uncharacterized protein LOC118557089 isoform X2 [Fundulus heteroclitus]
MEQFESLLGRVGPRISRIHTNYREPISSRERLAICLRYLATGDSYTTIASSYRMGISTVADIVPDVSKAIWDSLVDEFLPVPKVADWHEIALGIQERWNFSNCVGAIDGKHVVIQAPHNSGWWMLELLAGTVMEGPLLLPPLEKPCEKSQN